MTENEKIDVFITILQYYSIGIFFSIVFCIIEHVYFDRRKLDVPELISIVYASVISWFILLPWILWDLIVMPIYKRFK